MEKNPNFIFKECKKTCLLLTILLVGASLLSSFQALTNLHHSDTQEIKRSEAVNGICANEYILFTTSSAQDYKEVGDDAMFLLNGGSVCDPGDTNDIDNVHIKFINGSNTTNIRNCFFKVKNMNYSNQYVYGLRTPNYGTGTYTKLTFHLWTGNNRKRKTEYYPITFNVSIDLSSSFSSNVFHINCSSKTITSHESIPSQDIYDAFGRYFLSMCPCSGRGDEVDKENVTSSWARIKSGKIFTDSKIPVELKNYFASYDTFDGSDISLAIQRYDYILFYKRYELDDFLNRSTLMGERYESVHPTLYYYKEENNIQTFVIIVSSSIAFLSITSLLILLIKKRKLRE